MMGGALGLAVLASLAASYGGSPGAAGGAAEIAAANRGYQLAFGAGAVFALVAAVLGAWLPARQAVAPAPASPSVEAAVRAAE
jgi:hypothetical protein